MLKISIKYLLISSFILASTLWSQIPTQEVTVDLFPYLQILLKRAKNDINKVILDNKLNERVAITRFESTGIKVDDKYRTLIIKNFEETRLENKFFHLVGSIEALNKTVPVDSELELYTPEQLAEMERFSTELYSDYYAIINLSVVGKAITLTLIIKNAKEHNIIWGKKWSTILRKGTTSFNLGFYQGITFGGTLFQNNMYPLNIHFGIDWKIFNFVDFGFYTDPGANILYPNNSTDNILGFGLAGGIKIAIDLINIFNVLYKNVELPLYVRAGLNFNYNISHIQSYMANTPIFSITGRPGIAVIINRDYAIFTEFDFTGLGTSEKAIYCGFFYRFEF